MVVGNGESIAFELTIRAKAQVVGRTVGEVATSEGFPRSCVVAGMVTGGAVQAPRLDVRGGDGAPARLGAR